MLRLISVLVALPLTLATLTAVPAAAQAPAPSDPEATSLLGRALVAPEIPPETREHHEAALEQLRARPSHDADALVWTGRHLGYLARYREAVDLFTDGIDRFPEDARFLRHRGHRRITLRDLDGAVEDLAAGVALAAGEPDRVEPDGLPNLYNRPTGTLKTNLWYHLGLAHYLRGDFTRAAEAYTVCWALADNPDMEVAADYWRYLSLTRAGRIAEAQAVLDRAALEVTLLENHDYQRLLRLFAAEGAAGDALAAELLEDREPGSVSAVTVAYGVGAWHLVAGRREQAMEIFRRVVDGDGWAGFGYIAAEAELARDETRRTTPAAIQ